MRLALHTLLELHGCDPARLQAAAALEPMLCEAIRAAGGTIVNRMFHNFNPHGVTGVVVISESHVAIHTWPEKGFAAVDIFSCSDALDHAALERRLAAELAASKVTSRAFERG